MRTDGVKDPLFVGKLASIEFRVHKIAVERELEAPAGCRDQLQLADLLFVGCQEFARQTDGLRLVVSHRAVFQFDFHHDLLHLDSGVAIKLLQ
jgi:hypothetical protein